MRKLGSLILAIGLLIGCTVPVTFQKLTDLDLYPAKKNVDILTEEPKEKYWQVALLVVSLEDVSFERAVEAMAIKARTLGADALLVMKPVNYGTSTRATTMTIGSIGVVKASSFPATFATTIAIKYLGKGEVEPRGKKITIKKREVFVVRRTNFEFLPTSSVEVLAARPANREYIELAEISISLNGITDETALSMLYEEARKMGADALIILSEKEKGDINIGILMGVAIRYK